MNANSSCAVIVMGVSGSGKTTVAELIAGRLGWPFMEGDRLHPPANVEKMRQGVPLTDADRAPWLDRIGEELKRWAAEGQSGVLTCSALKRAYRDCIRSMVKGPVRFILLNGPRELIALRMAGRKGHFMPPALLDSQLATLERPDADEDAIILDITETVGQLVDEAYAAAKARPAGGMPDAQVGRTA